ncbi:Chaperone DnaJ-domain superfamily protein putative isoform 1 [Tripterygium wilfordii]|uniref:Chaperone DnaJ-domain superfamily protein putative isoform 1 n=1 Tax=Tripterygium wilfordii TaxID=458696 RepID=A0A7J7CPN0_TRIWF|nr:auxilin-like protein 1 [Tripterygium wilfordii]KAF5736021.1 Chaperone DnaJ-domain superfamily protein putative isoform 1 [Tripterygium wilfordii]
MESYPHSRQTSTLSKKTCNGAAAAAKGIAYDDVFGGPPRFGMPQTLAPRVEDYSEIFGAFHASRASSIPVLDLPSVEDDAEVFFDVRSSGFDYGEVFGGFDAMDFAMSYEDLLRTEETNGHGGNADFSEEDCTPAASESLSEVSDDSAKNLRFSNQGVYEPVEDTTEFSISYHRANQGSNADISNGITQISQFHSFPGYTLLVDKNTCRSGAGFENPSTEVTENSNLNMDFSGEMKGKHLRKTLSYSCNGGTDMMTFGNDLKPQKEYRRNESLPNEMFVKVSDVSLRTQPSRVPPPSRPPPALDIGKADSSRASSSSKSAVSETTAGDNSPRFFDVDIDASSSAAASAAAMVEAMEKAQAKLRSAKDSLKKKRENSQNCAITGSKKDRKGKVDKTFEISSCMRDESLQSDCAGDLSGMRFSIKQERYKATRSTDAVQGSVVGEKRLDGAKASPLPKDSKEFWSTQEPDKIDIVDEWKEANQFFELVKVDRLREKFVQTDGANILLPNSKQQECKKKEKKSAPEAYGCRRENDKKSNPVGESYELEGYESEAKVLKGAYNHEENSVMSETVEWIRTQKEHEKKVNIAQEALEHGEDDKMFIADQQPVETVNKSTGADESEVNEDSAGKENKYAFHQSMKLEKAHLKETNNCMEGEKRSKKSRQRRENEDSQLQDFKGEENERKLLKALKRAEEQKRLKEGSEQEEKEKMINKLLEQEENEKKQIHTHRDRNQEQSRKALELEEMERRLKEAIELEQNERKQREACEREENEKRVKEALELEESERRLREAIEWEETERKQREAREREQNEKMQKEALEWVENEKKQRDADKKGETEKKLKEDAENDGERLEELFEQKVDGKLLGQPQERKESEMELREPYEEEETGRTSRECCEGKETKRILENACDSNKLKGGSEIHEQTKQNNEQKKTEVAQGMHGHLEGEGIRVFNERCLLDEHVRSAQFAVKHEDNSIEVEANKDAFVCEKKLGEPIKASSARRNSEAVEVENMMVDGKSKASSLWEGDVILKENVFKMKDVAESLNMDDSVNKARDDDVGQTSNEKIKSVSEMNLEIKNRGRKFVNERGESKNSIKHTQVTVNQVDNKEMLMSTRVVKESVETGRKIEAAEPALSQVKGSSRKAAYQVNIGQSAERKEKNFNEARASEEKEAARMKREGELEQERLRWLEEDMEREREREKDRMKREGELEQERLRRLEEEMEREREREKDRMAVDRSAFEARDRTYAEARERAERAAVDRATAEARQRALAEARERLEKACAEARGKTLSEKTSIEGRLRAERAAVERATAEARERAEKAMAEKVTFEARERMERSISDKFSASSRNGGMRPNSSSSDLQNQFQNVNSFGGSAYSYSSAYGDEVEVESPQRCKARLERHQRTADRAAKALAEKNMRDLLAQREQMERNRLAESLDADVRRWSSGKEGNLRALLSTLQYILGPDMGWQSIPLTEVITSAAVKKAYRKATLCVHPDKLQQRGASIQQKYICEKVFDLLKDAWNRFNSEER